MFVEVRPRPVRIKLMDYGGHVLDTIGTITRLYREDRTRLQPDAPWRACVLVMPTCPHGCFIVSRPMEIWLQSPKYRGVRGERRRRLLEAREPYGHGWSPYP